MEPSQEPYIRFADLIANPYLVSLHDAMRVFLPDSHWWISDETLNRLPFPNDPGPMQCEECENEIPASIQIPPGDHEGSLSRDPLIEVCCSKTLQGFVPFYYRGKFWGGVGVCRIAEDNREVLEKILFAISGYLALLAGSLEDHDDLEVMHSIWAETTTMVDLESLLKRISEELCRSMGVGHAVILLINEDGEYYPAHVHHYPPAILKRRDLGVTRYEYGEPRRSGISVVHELEEQDPIRSWLVNALHETNAVSDANSVHVKAIPFFRNAVTIGLFLTLDPHERLNSIKNSLLRLLATGGGAALDNALTVERMNKRRKALSTIHVVHRLMSSTFSTDEILPKIGQLTRQLLQARKCVIYLTDETSERLLPIVQLGLEEGEIGSLPCMVGEDLPGWVAENFNPIIFHPEGDIPPWDDTGATYPSDAYLAVALFDTDIEGVIMVSDKSDDFTPGDREILVTFAEQAVLAIKNARVHEGERTITVNALKSIANLIETHDPAKPGITSQTCEWARLIGRAMQIPDRECQNITYAALLHDTGMLRTFQTEIPYDELRRKGPQLSMRVVESLGLSKVVCEIVYHVNESWNGEGYPDGLKGEEIPLGSRVVAVANAYATLLNRGGALQTMDKQTMLGALKILQRLSTRSYDPNIINSLESIIRERSVNELLP